MRLPNVSDKAMTPHPRRHSDDRAAMKMDAIEFPDEAVL
jgi:hypothetical protein